MNLIKTNHILKLIVILFWAVTSVAAQNQSGIYGRLNLSDQWEPIAYLSYIPNMNERYTMANALIIQKTVIKPDGSFYFNNRFLPKEDALYRIHVSKKGDPPASLIIGGRDENFRFVIANDSSSVFIHHVQDTGLFLHAHITGYPPNNALNNVIQWSHFADSSSFIESSMKKELIESAVKETLRLLADTCSHPLVSLFALYQSNFEVNKKVHLDFYEDYLAKWEDENSEYFKVFRNQFPRIQTTNSALLWGGVIGGIMVGVMLGWFLFKQQVHPVKTDTLSIQEKKIYKLLQAGKSNKEISEEYNIGLSTVKSHVSNILAKLGAKSRKEIMDV